MIFIGMKVPFPNITLKMLGQPLVTRSWVRLPPGPFIDGKGHTASSHRTDSSDGNQKKRKKIF